MNGEAQQEIDDYMAEEHTFEEYCEVIQTIEFFLNTRFKSREFGNIKMYYLFQQIEKYRTLSQEILSLPSIEHYDMIKLDCEDLKRGLADEAKMLSDSLLTRVSDDHRKENSK